eukprot:NODE_659_length_1283_cov_66.545848_g620_i0.p1 GENE.NODE_659_length_1283_cov_66.545848_g620_i0~~NODE_659_length_1283_cov_66.545848_g620_i0.p1  ORF type:complete len:379 (+),score=81.09 NODE_659_length_1283_cov_66.545848_g620_i0:49-1185(+)
MSTEQLNKPEKGTGVFIPKYGGVDVLTVLEIDIPTPGPDEVLVEVKAAGLNFAELMAREGLYPDAPKKFPICVGYEGSGIVIASGDGKGDVDIFPGFSVGVGDRVLFMIQFGAHKSHVIVPKTNVIPMPEGMTFVEAAAMPVTYVTAYHSLIRCANLRKNESVLIHAASGGVGTASIQIARSIENITIFGTSSASKHDFLKKLGVDHCIDYRTSDFETQVKQLTEGKGVNVIMDAQGGSSFAKGLRILKKPGRLVAFGVASFVPGERRSLWSVISGYFATPNVSFLDMMDRNFAVFGVNMGKYFDSKELVMDELQELQLLYKEGKIRPIVDSIYKFSDAANASLRMHQRLNMGKVLLVPDDQFPAIQAEFENDYKKKN